MNDRAVSILDQYDIEVVRTKKGRGVILCESRQGLYVLTEFTGSKEKAATLNLLLTQLQENCAVPVDSILKNKEGELFTVDADGTKYMVKTWLDGRECNVKDMGECERAVCTLADLHQYMKLEGEPLPDSFPVFSLQKEYERHNRELKKVRRFLREKSQKTEFELFLNRHLDFFMEQAAEILEDYKSYGNLEKEEEIRQQGILCHGDYQHHNILVTDGQMAVINFEKFVLDQPSRDLYLFMRKILEKSNWTVSAGERLLKAYVQIRPLSAAERINLYYRFAYPEKFWKIVNFYYNSAKAWIPGKNMEKLQKVLQQEPAKQQFLDKVFRTL